MELLIVTGISGAGKTQAAHALEDIGFYCADNIPPQLLRAFCEICANGDEAYGKVAVIADVRCRKDFHLLHDAVRELGMGKQCRMLFLDASDDVLLRRYRFTRRKHPLLDACDGSLEAAIAAERMQLAPLKARADHLIDTTFLSNAQLKERIAQLYLAVATDALTVHCVSFGYKYGLPAEADLMFDVRCLPNPYYVDELKEHTGLEAPVFDYVMKWEQTIGFRDRLFDMIDYLLPLYCGEGRSQLVVAIGCTGGHHRSVAMAQALHDHLRRQGRRVTVTHRDIEK